MPLPHLRDVNIFTFKSGMQEKKANSVTPIPLQISLMIIGQFAD